MREFLLGVALLCAGCNARVVGGDPGVAAVASEGACEKNAQGICYPTDDIGTKARDDTHWGNRIPNMKFVGYRSERNSVLDTSGAPVTVALGDYYDPEGVSGNVMLVITSNMMWCGPSNEQADFMSGANYTGTNTKGASWAHDLAPLGVVFVEALNDGQIPGVGATFDDLRSYTSHHASDYTSVLDPGQTLAEFFPYSPDPDVLVVDLRSMEIISATVGFDSNGASAFATLARNLASTPPHP